MAYVRTILIAVLSLVVTNQQGYAQMQSQTDIDQARDEIWALEQSIYASRGEGNFQPYIDGASNNYIAPFPTGGWAPGKDGLLRTGGRLEGNASEKIDMNFKTFTLHDDTAVIYYLNNRTVRPDGEAVDEWYEVMHVWARDGDGWTLVASMPRLVEDYSP